MISHHYTIIFYYKWRMHVYSNKLQFIVNTLLALKVQIFLPIVIVLVAFTVIDLVVDSGAVLVEEILIVALEDVPVGMTNEEVAVLSAKERIRSKE